MTPDPSMEGMGHAQCSYSVTRTSTEHASVLAPVTFAIRYGGVWGFQDYLTLEEAELLAGTLRACARRVREEREQYERDFGVIADAARTPYTPADEAA